MKTLTLALLSTAMALTTAGSALADTATLSLTTTDPTLSIGGTVTFDGIIAAPQTNSGAISLLSDSFTAGAPLITDDTDFINDTPVSLGPGQSYDGPLFTVSLPGSAAEGTYSGFYNVVLEDSSFNTFTDTASFAVTATPEPGSWLLLSTGLGSVALLRRRFQRG